MELDKAREISNVYEEYIDLSSPMPEDDRNRVFHTQREKSSYEGIKEKLRLDNLEIVSLRREQEKILWRR